MILKQLGKTNMTLSKSVITAALLALFSYAPLSAHAGLLEDDEARKAILDLRAKVDMINRELLTQIETKADKTSSLELINQNEQLRQEMAKLRGQVELLTNELSNTQLRQKDFYNDLDNRLRAFEPQKVTVDGQEMVVEPAEQKSFDAAMLVFKAGDYKSAEVSLTDFLRRYPSSAYASTAQYTLGNTYYAQRDCKSAIAAQQVVVKRFPDSAKAPDALFSIASCYTELKNKPGAKKSLEALISQYPDSEAAHTAKERLGSFK
jgi:tol-pal system protein YbgF